MKKILPVIIALLLIVVIVGAAFGGKLLDKYTYSKEVADLDEYYGVTDAAVGESDGRLAIILQNDMLVEQAVVKNGVVYFDLNTVRTYFNEIFYVDETEQKLLFTSATDTTTVGFGETVYSDGEGEHPAEYVICMKDGEQLFVAAEYVRKFANFTYEKYDRHLQVYTEWGIIKTYDIAKATQLRVRGGIKSPILRELEAGETVELLEQMDTWSRVKTSDAMIGYVENKRLTNLNTEVQTAVTDYVPAEYTFVAMDGKVSLGWHGIGGPGGNDTLDSVLKEGKGINVIAPTWFSLKNSDGELFRSFASAQYVKKAHEKGIKVWGVWDDFNYTAESGTTVDSYAVLSATSSRQQMAQNIVDTALEYGLDGINLDFEKLTNEARPHFNQFLRELSVLCRQSGLALSIDNYVPLNSSNYYRLDIQGLVADYVIIMGYDEHWGGCQEAGSVASIDYVSGGLDRTLEQVPAEKVVNALPFYTRLWMTKGAEVTSEAIPISNVEECLQKYGKSTDMAEWDEVTCQNYIEWQGNDTLYQMWIEDTESLSVKVNVMNARNIGGVAVWRLGYGTQSAWELVAAYAGVK